MTLRQRLLLLIMPVAVFPLLVVTLLALFFFEQVGDPAAVRLYEWIGLGAVLLTLGAIGWIIFSWQIP